MEVFWETNAVYAKPLDELGQRVVFARDGENNQTVNLEASLIGVYTLRFYSGVWKKLKTLIFQGSTPWWRVRKCGQVRRKNW